MTEPLVVLEQVSYQYPDSTDFALSNVNLEIAEGEFLGLIGPTGAGKTTLCLALNGIVPQFYGGRFFGSVRITGRDSIEHPISVLAQLVGQVFEDPETQLIATSIENEIAFALENLKVPRDVILDRIPQVLSELRLEGMAQKHPHELSVGQKQRLAIAAALAVQPRLLVLDEPTSQLDPVGTEEVFSALHELNRELGMTIVMASHAAEEMAAFAHRIALLAHGEILAAGTPDEIYPRIDLLRRSSLRPPQVASTFYSLGARGVPVPIIPVRMKEAAPLLADLATREPNRNFKIPPLRERSGKSLISVRDLSHVYPDGTGALHEVSLDIYEGEYVLIIGQNGAGKSTLVKHFVNLLQPTSGSVKVSGQETSGMAISDLARRIGYVAQNPDNQIFNKTVREEIQYALKNLEFGPEEIESRTTHSLQAMGLLDVQDLHPLSLPKGDRARVVIGAILAMRPDIIIFDEPTTGQDYRGARYILDLSRELHKAGKTVIVITHHLYLMPDYAERALVMGKGKLILDQDIRTAFHAKDTLKRTFLTAPQAVELAQELQKWNQAVPDLLTPEEIADYLSPEGSVS